MLTIDRGAQRRRQRQEAIQRHEHFAHPRRAETGYAVQLRKIARQVGHLIDGTPGDDPSALSVLTSALERYSVAIRPWSVTTASYMLAEVARRDEKAWAEHSRGMARALQVEIRTAPTGEAMRLLLAEQVALITSLPIEAGERVHRLTIEGLTNSTRAAEIAHEIGRSGAVTISRANLIARTEVGRTASVLTQVRAEHIGSEGYVWRTARDSDVRASHKAMEGKFVGWGAPPTLDGLTGHAGALPNCRCYPEVVVPNEFD